MVIDTSALVAILQRGPERRAFIDEARAVAAGGIGLGAPLLGAGPDRIEPPAAAVL